MKKLNRKLLHASRTGRLKKWAGFTLVELMMAMLLFMIVGAAAVSLIKKHMPLYASQQNQASMNVGVRNAVAQMQMDVVNAGSGFYPGANMPFFPVGITIVNSGTTGCFDANFNYTGCFDKLTVLTADDTIPPAHPSGNALGTATIDTSTPGGTIFLTFGGSTPPSNANLTKWATSVFVKGVELLFIQGGTDFSNSTPRMTTVILSSDTGTVSGNAIQVTITPTQAGGVPASSAPDQMGIITTGDVDQLTSSFDPAQDYAIHLTGVTYGIDDSDTSNPKLVRVPYNAPLTGAQNVLAEQIIGFKVGAWSSVYSVGKLPPIDYSYNSSAPNGLDPLLNGYNNDWTSIKAVRIDLTARAAINTDPSYKFTNKLDGGPYQVQKISVVINPRNLSM